VASENGFEPTSGVDSSPPCDQAGIGVVGSGAALVEPLFPFGGDFDEADDLG